MDCYRVINILIVLVLTVFRRGFSQQNDQSKLNNKQIMKSLCQYVGVNFVKNPDAPLCTYMKCEKNEPIEMRCTDGLRVAPHFMWGETYPCTQRDIRLQCDAYKRYIKTRRDRQQQQYMYRLRQAQAAKHWQMEQKRLAEEMYKRSKQNTGKDDKQPDPKEPHQSDENTEVLTQERKIKAVTKQTINGNDRKTNDGSQDGGFHKIMNQKHSQMPTDNNSMTNAGMPNSGVGSVPEADGSKGINIQKDMAMEDSSSLGNKNNIQIQSRPNIHTVDVNIPEGTPIDMNKLIHKLNQKLFSISDKNRANSIGKGEQLLNSGDNGQLYSDAMQQSKVWKITHIRNDNKEVVDQQRIAELNKQLQSNVNKGKNLELHVYVK